MPNRRGRYEVVEVTPWRGEGGRGLEGGDRSQLPDRRDRYKIIEVASQRCEERRSKGGDQRREDESPDKPRCIIAGDWLFI